MATLISVLIIGAIGVIGLRSSIKLIKYALGRLVEISSESES